MPYLSVISGPSAGAWLDLPNGQPIQIGRAELCDLRVFDPAISSVHCQLTPGQQGSGDEHFLLEDLGSSNGCYVDGQRIEQARIHIGGQFLLGDSFFILLDRPPTRAQTTELVEETWGNIAHRERLAKNATITTSLDPEQTTPEHLWRAIHACYQAMSLLQHAESLEAAYDGILELLLPTYCADRGGIALRDEMGLYEVVAIKKPDDNIAFTPSQTVLSLCIEEGEGLWANQQMAQQLFTASDSLHRQRVTSVLCVPLGERAPALGAIYLDSQSNGAAFDRHDLQLLSFIARLIGGELEVRRANEEARQLRLQLQAAVRMESVGQLAGGLVHDLGNLLTAILGFTDLLRKSPDDDELRRLGLGRIAAAGGRATTLSKRLLSLARSHEQRATPLLLSRLIDEMAEILTQLVGKTIALSIQHQQPQGAIRAIPAQVEQVVLNLVLNARDALGVGGSIEVSTRDLSLEQPPSDQISLVVRDNGSGIDPALLERIFDPLFTTKAPGLGTGLGLATVDRILKQHGAACHVTSSSTEGTTFEIRWPRAPMASEPTPTDQGAPPPREPVQQATVLIVEPDEDVRQLAREALADAGHTVLCARSAGEALTICEPNEVAINLLICEVEMPLLDGPDLARRLARVYPGLRTLYLSGYPAERLVDYQLGAPDQLLQKPFTLATLLEFVDRQLQGR